MGHRISTFWWSALAAAVLVGVALGSGFGCNASRAASSAPPAPDSLSDEAKAEAAAIFHDRCANCHGSLGKGDGPNARSLKPRPRNFSDPTWQLAVSDRHIDKIIQFGGVSVGKSAQMPGNPDLVKRPEVLVALRQHVRVLAAQP